MSGAILHLSSVMLRRNSAVVLLLVTSLAPILAASDMPCPGRIDLDIAKGPVQSGHAIFYLTFKPTISRHPSTALVHFGPDNWYDVTDDKDKDAGEWALVPNVRTKFKLAMKQSNPGVIELVANANWDASCPHPDDPIDTGFRDVVDLESKTKGFIVRSESSAEPDPIQPGPQPIDFDFIERNGRRPIRLGAPVTLEISITGPAQLRQKDGTWGSSPVFLTTDGSRISSLEMKNDVWGSNGTIDLNIHTKPASPTIASFQMSYRTDFPWYVLFMMTLVGALLYVAIESIPSLNRPPDGSAPPPYWRILLKDDGSKLFVALVVAIVAFLMKDTSILGAIKFDPTTLKGYAILGLFANVIGLEAIFKKVKQLVD
jgi:hypothetical protein